MSKIIITHLISNNKMRKEHVMFFSHLIITNNYVMFFSFILLFNGNNISSDLLEVLFFVFMQ